MIMTGIIINAFVSIILILLFIYILFKIYVERKSNLYLKASLKILLFISSLAVVLSLLSLLFSKEVNSFFSWPILYICFVISQNPFLIVDANCFRGLFFNIPFTDISCMQLENHPSYTNNMKLSVFLKNNKAKIFTLSYNEDLPIILEKTNIPFLNNFNKCVKL